MTHCLGVIKKLDHQHNLTDFDCGNLALNEYIKKYALINQKLNISQTYVGVSDATVLGYYSLAVASIQHEQAPKKIARGLPKYAIPVMLIGRLAVDLNYQGQKVGAGLLKDAILRTQKVSEIVGIRALIVHAKNEDVAKWYQKFDFEPSPLDVRHLFLLLKDVSG